ncbi:MAG: cyclopropane fatty acyl phospholipid synthase, partial [Gammaproteobacteria bacterium]|nr:cyclopropane fatty acyl phospholipid synthase [Gammaproteobacteria bacterium]
MIKPNPAKSLILDLLKYTDIEINGPKPYDLQIHNELFYKRILREGSLALGESYMDGWWDCAALDQFFAKIFAAEIDKKIKFDLKVMTKLFFRKTIYALHNPQNKKRAFMVGEQHYDIGNDLYQRMLDPTMSYTCAYWKEATTLEEAQLTKLELICQKLQLKPGMRLLDIGCGFGGMAEYAARRYQVEVVGLTISKEQQALGMARCKGLPIDLRLQDYREINEKFDRIVSIGMFEHVGPKNYLNYMQVAANALKDPDSLFLLHTIGANRSKFEADPWINKYIFPNGALPSIAQIASNIEGLFVMEDWHNFGFCYYKTLMAWHSRFNQHYPEIKDQYNERFFRMWNYYLLCSAGAFYARDIQLWQIVLSKKGIPG